METLILEPAAPLKCTGRAHDILLEMRRKRESLIAKTSKNKSSGRETRTTSSLRSSNNKTRKKRKDSKTKKKKDSKSSRAQDILVDMKSKRASLSSVLEACKQTSSKRSSRSGGPSTAPTAASTRSFLSSLADDDDSFCDSENSSGQPGFEIIIETEAEDSSDLSTTKEVEQVVGTIYEQVIPKALSVININEEERKPTSLNVISENKATQFCYADAQPRSEKRKKRRKKPKKDKKKKDKVGNKDSSSYISGESSSASSSIDIADSDAQLSRMKSLLDSVSDLGDSEQYKGVTQSSNKTPTEFQSQQLLAEKEKRRIRRSDRRKETEKLNGPSTLSAEYSFDRQSLIHQSQRSASQKERSNCLASPSNSIYRQRPRQDDSSCGSRPLLSSSKLSPVPTHSADTNLRKSLPSEQQKRKRKKKKENCDNSRKEEEAVLDIPDVKSEESGVIIFQDEIDNPLSLSRGLGPRKEYPRSRSKLELAPATDAPAPRKLRSRSIMEKTSLDEMDSKPTRKSPCDEGNTKPLIECKETYTMEDIMAEMNRLAAVHAKEGLRIPNGTVLNLYGSTKAHSMKSKNDDNSSTGWSFSGVSDVSTLGCSCADYVPEQSVPPKKGQISDDISKRFCGGMYHIAALSGMPVCQEEI